MEAPDAALVVHGHFYQPPRENPWTGTVERQPTADPFHNWNERVFRECYRPNAYARVLDESGRVLSIVNNYLHISFNFGPTLLSWLEREHTITYGRIIEADRVSRHRHDGHGNAIAQVYNHCILPLCNMRDRRTQVRWGVRDFRSRFGRAPEGIWLAETAAHHSVLDLLIEEGLRFTILSPYQAARFRKLGEDDWEDALGGRIDPTRAYRYFHRDGSQRSLELLFYDGPLSKSIAFEGALSSSQAFVNNLRQGRGHGPLINVATDGESYGHHFHFGDRTLAHAMQVEAEQQGLWVTNYGSFLDRHPPEHEVELDHGPDELGTSWSCAHGVGRWYRDCGCSSGAREDWNQGWRTPLRQALDFLRDEAITLFESVGGALFKDPWAARDDYIGVLIEEEHAGPFFERHTRTEPNAQDRIKALTLLDMQHQAMLMYTSCGWFFADISGIETQQCLRYAGRTLDSMKELGHVTPFEPFLERLAEAKSNLATMGTGADVYLRFVDSARVSPRRVTAHLAISELVDDVPRTGLLARYRYQLEHMREESYGHLGLVTARVNMENVVTGRPHAESVAALHLGGVDFYCVVRSDFDREAFDEAEARLWDSLATASLPTLLRLVAVDFGSKEYGLEQVLPGGAERISGRIMGDLLHRFSEQYAYLYEDNRRTLEMLQSAGLTLPKELTAAAELTLGRRFEQAILEQNQSRDPAAYRRAIEIAEQAFARGYRLDQRTASQTFESMITHSVHTALARQTSESLRTAEELLNLAERLRLNMNLERAQEAVYMAAVQPTRSPWQPEFKALMSALHISPSPTTP